jgi:hypothetical protein
MIVASDRFLPDRGGYDDLFADLARDGYLTDVLIPEGSELIGQSIACTARSATSLRRGCIGTAAGGATPSVAPLADLPLHWRGIRLLLRCNRDNLLRLQQEHTIILAPSAAMSPTSSRAPIIDASTSIPAGGGGAAAQPARPWPAPT